MSITPITLNSTFFGVCLGDSSTWLSRRGTCQTYSHNDMDGNHASCHSDVGYFSHLPAYMVCPECEECTVPPMSTVASTSRPDTTMLPECQGHPAVWTSQYGTCITYHPISGGNNAFCDTDKGLIDGLFAAQVCPECGACAPADALPACTVVSSTWVSDYGTCASYDIADPRSNNHQFCDTDSGILENQLAASQVCEECGACVNMPVVTTPAVPVPRHGERKYCSSWGDGHVHTFLQEIVRPHHLAGAVTLVEWQDIRIIARQRQEGTISFNDKLDIWLGGELVFEMHSNGTMTLLDERVYINASTTSMWRPSVPPFHGGQHLVLFADRTIPLQVHVSWHGSRFHPHLDLGFEFWDPNEVVSQRLVWGAQAVSQRL